MEPTVKAPNRFTVLGDFVKMLLSEISPAAAGLLGNLAVKAGRHGSKPSKAVQPGQVLTDGKWIPTGAWNVDVVLTDDYAGNHEAIRDAAGSYYKRAVLKENGGKPSKDLQLRVKRAWMRVLERRLTQAYPEKKFDAPAEAAVDFFNALVGEFVRKTGEKKAKRNMLKVYFKPTSPLRVENDKEIFAPENHFFINANPGSINAAQFMASELHSALWLAIDDQEKDISAENAEALLTSLDTVPVESVTVDASVEGELTIVPVPDKVAA